MENKVGRNDPCSCGSGKKYKNCCLQKDQQKVPALSKWKFTAKVLNADGGGSEQQKNESMQEQQTKVAMDYTALMERSFGESLHTHEDKPPTIGDPSVYLAKEENVEEGGEGSGKE